MYVSRDLDRHGTMGRISPSGNSGDHDGVFWLEQAGTKAPRTQLYSCPGNRKSSLTSTACLLAPCKTTHIAPKKAPAGP